MQQSGDLQRCGGTPRCAVGADGRLEAVTNMFNISGDATPVGCCCARWLRGGPPGMCAARARAPSADAKGGVLGAVPAAVLETPTPPTARTGAVPTGCCCFAIQCSITSLPLPLHSPLQLPRRA
jgi:hypothetical protein